MTEEHPNQAESSAEARLFCNTKAQRREFVQLVSTGESHGLHLINIMNRQYTRTKRTEKTATKKPHNMS